MFLEIQPFSESQLSFRILPLLGYANILKDFSNNYFRGIFQNFFSKNNFDLTKNALRKLSKNQGSSRASFSIPVIRSKRPSGK